MARSRNTLSQLVASILGATGPFVTAARAQDESLAEQASRLVQESPSAGHETIAFHLEGFVLGPDGAPAEGARVVSSAGGQTVTDAAGAFRLETHSPLQAQGLEITAVGRAGMNLRASQQVPLPATSANLWVGGLSLVRGGTCSPHWIPTFGTTPGVNGIVRAMTVFDVGTGPALCVAGDLWRAGGLDVQQIASWDGSDWSTLGTGMDGTVHAVTVFDDGGGEALYAAGAFTTAGGVPANRIARWNGSSWSPLGSGLSGGTAIVHSLTVFDDGTGPALYAGGTFTQAGGVSASRIARWNGASWEALGAGTSAAVHALTVFDDGSGPALYAGGNFVTAGGVSASRVARWDGTSWSPLGSGVSGFGAFVYALAAFNDGSGNALYAGGSFTVAGGATANRIAKWDGSSWSPLVVPLSGNGLGDEVFTLATLDDGTGEALHAGGLFLNCIRKWDGTAWSGVGVGGSDVPYVRAMAVFDSGEGAALHAGGRFLTAGNAVVQSIAKLDGMTMSWSSLGTGITGDSLTGTGSVQALAQFDDGSGSALYVGGSLAYAGGATLSGIAKWDGAGLSSLGVGVHYFSWARGSVGALEVFDDGSGSALFAAGAFDLAGQVTANGIAKWDGTNWSALGSGLTADGLTAGVFALETFDDGSGAALFAGGNFLESSTLPLNHIAKWDGVTWSPLASPSGNGTNGIVEALAVFDDGTGPAVYAGGQFSMAGDVNANLIARWDGTKWSPLGAGIGGGTVSALATFDDGSGAALYVGGSFTMAGGVVANNIARWDGLTWTPLSSGLDQQPSSLLGYDLGDDPALYAGGWFTTAGGLAASRIAKWDGESWSALGGGMSANAVSCLLALEHPNGSALYAGGNFNRALDSGDSNLARWGCLDTAAPVLAMPEVVFRADVPPYGVGEVVHFRVTASDDLDPAPVVQCTPASGSVFPVGVTHVTCTATDASGNVATGRFRVTIPRRR